MKTNFYSKITLYLSISLLFIPAVQAETGTFELNQAVESEEVWSNLLAREINFEFKVDISSSSEVKIELDSPQISSSKSLAAGESWVGNGKARTVTIMLENVTGVASGSWQITITGDSNEGGALGPASILLVGLLITGIIAIVILKRD